MDESSANELEFETTGHNKSVSRDEMRAPDIQKMLCINGSGSDARSWGRFCGPVASEGWIGRVSSCIGGRVGEAVNCGFGSIKVPICTD